MPRYLIWLKQTISTKWNDFLFSLGLMHLIKCKSVLLDISNMSYFTCFLILIPKKRLFTSPFIAYNLYLNDIINILSLDLLSLFTISSRIKSLFFYLKPYAMYSIYPGVCFIINDLRKFTLLEGGKCSCWSCIFRTFDKKSSSRTLTEQLSSNRLNTLLFNVSNNSMILILSVKLSLDMIPYSPSFLRVFFSCIKTCSR